MMTTPTYSVAICNLDMVGTIEQSLRRMLHQTDDRFEFVVVDGGSRDGSVDVLEKLSEKYDRLRPVFLERDSDRSLGEDRNTAFEHTKGDFIIESLDVDDLYYDGAIPDFVEIFEQVNDGLEREILLHGIGINIAPRSLLVEEFPYRPVSRSEDRDLWRRLFAADRMIWLTHEEVSHSIGYDRGLYDRIQTDIEEKICDFQTGVTLSSCLQYTLSPGHFHVLEERRGPIGDVLKRFYDFVTYPYAYLRALGNERYPAPEEFSEYAALERAIVEQRVTINGLREQYGIDVNCDRLTEEGKERFCDFKINNYA